MGTLSSVRSVAIRKDTTGTEKQQEDQTPHQAPQHGALHRANKNLYHLAWKTNEAYLGKVLTSAGLGSRDFRCQWAGSLPRTNQHSKQVAKTARKQQFGKCLEYT